MATSLTFLTLFITCSGVGPAHYTPGTKMPEQTIGVEEDRKALVNFIARATVN